MLCLSRKRMVVTKDRPHGPGHGAAYQCSLVECEDHSAIQAPLSDLLYIDSYVLADRATEHGALFVLNCTQ